MAFLGQIAFGQLAPQSNMQSAPGDLSWRKLGNDSVGVNLAGPAGGPVDQVWFSTAGDRLFVRTRAGVIFETSDFSRWAFSRNPLTPVPEMNLGGVPSPETGAKVVQSPTSAQLFALGLNLQASDDFGRTWNNLTAFNRTPVIGAHQHAVAVSPLDRRQIVVGNDFGVWRTADSGMSWSSLNEELPNLPIRRLLAPASSGSLRAEIDGIGTVELPPAAAASHANWILSAGASDQNELQRQAASKKLGTEITAFARTAALWFAGSADGRLWTSPDSGATWNLATARAAGRIEAIRTGSETDNSRGALAVASSMAGPTALNLRLFRTVDGNYWEDLSAGLPEGALHGVAVDSTASVAYVAGDKGVFTAHVDMNNLVPVSGWQQLPGLPNAAAMDVRLDSGRNLLYVAVEGYGLFSTPAPHKTSGVRVLTAADQPAESAAPGVLLHVQGSGLSRVRSDASDLAVVTTTASSAQVQVPFGASGSTLALTVDSAAGQSKLSLPLRAAAPSILVDGDGLPIVVDASSGLTLDARNMARPGTRIQVFASGLGKVDPEWRAGVPAPDDPPVVTALVTARLEGNSVEVTKATLAPGYVGLYLVEVQLPGLVNAGAADFSLVVNGEPSNHVKIFLNVQ
ncbi:MAG TPA: hypothetical protein VGL72_20665 [Bryobacteraceae bacterium]|jgi:uncharacterized protein (TIGR03437 family)